MSICPDYPSVSYDPFAHIAGTWAADNPSAVVGARCQAELEQMIADAQREHALMQTLHDATPWVVLAVACLVAAGILAWLWRKRARIADGTINSMAIGLRGYRAATRAGTQVAEEIKRRADNP